MRDVIILRCLVYYTEVGFDVKPKMLDFDVVKMPSDCSSPLTVGSDNL